MTATLQKVLPQSQSGSRALIAQESLTEEAEQRKLLGEYIRTQMTEGTDYGIIPGTKQKTLLKPGAEKLTQLFRCTPRFVIEEKIENWETGLFYYRFSCSIEKHDGTVVAEGVGSCSTFESRYRWRNGERLCPNCGKAAIIKGKAEYGGGWLCFAKKGGCGAKFSEGDQLIEGQSVGRVVNPDLLDCVNTVLKMAKKRSLVDAAIALARCSDIFTQDLEDLGEDHAPRHPAQQSVPPQSSAQSPTQPIAQQPVQQQEASPPVASSSVGISPLEWQRDRIRAAKTIPELAAIWQSLDNYPGMQTALNAEKEDRKKAIQSQTQ